MTFLSEPTPHAEASRLIRNLPAVDRATFDRLPDELKAAAFLITGISQHDVLQAVRNEVAGLVEGEDFEAVKERIAQRLQPLLGGNAKAAQTRALIICRHWMRKATVWGQVKQLDAHKGAFPFRKRLSVGDANVRDSHRELSGLILPAGSPFWEKHTPPDAHNCRCFVVGVTRRQAEAAKAADDAAIAARKLDPAKRTVLEGPLLKKLENEGILSRGPNEVYPLDREPGKVAWNPQRLLMPLDELKTRYDADTFADFEQWARGKDVGGKSLWQRLEGQRDGGMESGGDGEKAVSLPSPAAAVPAPAPVKTTAASTAEGDQVAAKVDVVPTGGVVKDAAEEALRAIAAVHSDGGLKLSPLVSEVMSAYGQYEMLAPDRERMEFAGSKLTINPAPDIHPHLVMTTLHELGHKADFEKLINFRREPREADSAAFKERAALLRKLRATGTIKTLRTHPDLSRKSRKYLLSDWEIFARGYAQWIATASGSEPARAELREMQQSPGERMRLNVWPDAEFAPMLERFAALFKALGWMA
jgi:hypothetical protein